MAPVAICLNGSTIITTAGTDQQRAGGPWKYIFLREFATAEEAREFEFHLKSLRRKNYILSKYEEYFLTSH